MSGAQEGHAGDERARLVAELAAECWRRGWTFWLREGHVFVGGRRVSFSAFEEDFEEAMNSLFDLIRSERAQAKDIGWYPGGGLYFDQGGWHIADKSG